jgi:putative ABC transport system permease protein
MRIPWGASSLQDLRHSVVLLSRDAGVSGLIVGVLALGIGGTSAIFTLLKAAFLDPLPYRDADRLVTVIGNRGNPNVWEFAALRARSRELQQLAFLEYDDMQLTGTDEPLRVYGARVTASLFSLLGVSALRGRIFSAEENQPDRTPVVLLSNTFWRARMAANPDAIGWTLKLDGKAAVVVGVLPPGFQFDYPTLGIPEPVDIYVALPLQRAYGADSSGQTGSRVLGRLRDGRTSAQARAELQSIARALVNENPSAFRDPDGKPTSLSFEVQPLREAIVGTQRPLLWLLVGGVSVLLMIACANTAQLLIARGLRRGREVAIRAALGATRPRLIRQFLLEGLVLSVCGGAAGLLLAVWIARLLVRMLPERSPILESAQVDARVMGFTLALSVLSALVFAIVPAVKASMSTLGPSLGARSIGPGSRWRHGMLTIEAALSTFLLCAAGLIATNLWNLISTPVGVDADHVTVMQLRLSPQREQALQPDPSRAYQNYIEKIQAMPGVDAVAIAWAPPLLPRWGGVIRIVGEPVRSGDVGYPAYSNSVSPSYFRTLRIPLLAGRSFREDDMRGREPVAIVSQEFARRAGVRNPVGRQLFPGYGPGETITIVGVAGDVRMRNLETAPFPVCYLSYRQLFLPDAYLLVRSALPQGQLVNGVKAAIRSSNPEQAVFNVRTHGASCHPLGYRTAVPGFFGGRFRAARPGDGRYRHVQRHLFPGFAAHQRNRHPRRAGRRPRRHHQNRSRYDEPLGSRRAGIRPRPGTGRSHNHPLTHRHRIRRLADDVHGRGPVLCSSDFIGRLPACPARHPARSGDGTAPRVAARFDRIEAGGVVRYKLG